MLVAFFIYRVYDVSIGSGKKRNFFKKRNKKRRTLFGANDLNLHDFLVSWETNWLVTLFGCSLVKQSEKNKKKEKGEEGNSINGFCLHLKIVNWPSSG